MTVSGPGELEVVAAEDGLSDTALVPDTDRTPGEIKGRSLWSIAWRRLRRRRQARLVA